ncbi:MAG: hypothetical protein K2W78_07095 [Xanthobacteraceae bacterium]|nr:hypothetical protein [Xanthobacteraceae bacterium]
MKPYAWTCAGIFTAVGVFTSFAACAQVVRVADELRSYGPAYRDSYAAVPIRRPPPPDADLMAPPELIELLRADGYSPLGPAMRRGWVYTIAVLDQNGDDGRLIVDARTGEPIRFIPAMRVDTRLNEELDSMYGPPGPPPAAFAPDPYRRVNPPPVPRTARIPAPPLHPAVTAAKPAHSAVKSAAIEPKPAAPRPVNPSVQPGLPARASVTSTDAAKGPADSRPGAKPDAAMDAQASAAPAATPKPEIAAKPAPAQVELKPTEPMPAMQTLE